MSNLIAAMSGACGHVSALNFYYFNKLMSNNFSMIELKLTIFLSTFTLDFKFDVVASSIFTLRLLDHYKSRCNEMHSQTISNQTSLKLQNCFSTCFLIFEILMNKYVSTG